MAKFLNRLSQALRKRKSTPSANGDVVAGKSKLVVGALINGRYHLEEEIGRGGMGIVFRAHDIPNDRDVAIKVINFDKANTLTLQQFLQEAEIMARLHHPHIVAVYETGTIEDKTSPFIAMELVRGKSLEELRALTYVRIVDIGKQICDALENAHQQGLVYRDLKPGNVLIEKRGFQYFVKLTDFGLARPRGLANVERESNVAGTIFYLAPELIAGQPADVASDLYALGATLYEMITGRVPFSDFDEQTILSQQLEESVTSPSQSRPDVPPALEAIVLRLLAKNPKDRLASAREACDALEQVTLAFQNDMGRTNLPEPSGEFIGLEKDIAQVKELLESNLLVTLSGNDEQLAIAVSKEVIHEFLDGVWWVELGQLSNPAMVAETVAASLGIQKDPQRSLIVSLVECLREKNLLLVLNHCNHVLEACTQLVETILRVCPDVRILAVSHDLLHVAGEASY